MEDLSTVLFFYFLSMATACIPQNTFFRSDIRSVIRFSSALSEKEKTSFLRHVDYLTPKEVEELRESLLA